MKYLITLEELWRIASVLKKYQIDSINLNVMLPFDDVNTNTYSTLYSSAYIGMFYMFSEDLFRCQTTV